MCDNSNCCDDMECCGVDTVCESCLFEHAMDNVGEALEIFASILADPDSDYSKYKMVQRIQGLMSIYTV